MAGTSTTTTTTTNSDEITSNHPLFLHQTDHPGLLLISKKLTGSDNYSSWKRSIMIALNAKNKMKLVTGEFPEPTIESDLRAIWERKNDMLISWILINGERDYRKRLIQFLMGLDESYSNIRGQILLII
ncbi:cysteine-rich receptor-like protein kinase 8 [Tanacetum coccineum]